MNIAADMRLHAALMLTACRVQDRPDAEQDADVDGDHDVDMDGDGYDGPIALPVLTPCPNGWVEVPPDDSEDPFGVATCDPWPEDGPAVLTPCPVGWREIPASEPGGVALCDRHPRHLCGQDERMVWLRTRDRCRLARHDLEDVL